MKKYLLIFLLCLSISPVVSAQTTKMDFGKEEYESRCANCHGQDGKGHGWLSYFLKVPPTDLTILAKNNGGILPADRLYASISGDNIPIHGTSDMPAWGRRYRREAPDVYLGVPYNAEIYTRGRILLLIEYINRLQTK